MVATSFPNCAVTIQKGMLLVLHCPLRVQDGKVLWESQACNGLERWADNFGSLVIAAPVIPEALVGQMKNMVWQDPATLSRPDRFEFVQLPWAYSLPQFLKTYLSTRRQLAELVQRCEYVQVGIGGLVGDWAAITALEAHRQNRKCAVHADRVEHQVVLNVAKQAGWKAQLGASISSPLMALFEKYVIKRSSLGLWHGQDCYAAYSPFCKTSYVVHDVHTKPSDAISAEALEQKVAASKTDPVLNICYAGRISAMKAPLEWVRAIGAARALGVNLQATWFGDGELKDEMKALVTELKLDSCIELYGLERDREKLLKRLRTAHLMMFTHVTPESPRCLVEALVSGTPMVGYTSSYVEELTETRGGGAFVPVHDWQKLGELIATLDRDRPRLSQLIQAAGTNGARFNDKAVFQERSELIKKHLQ